MFSAQTQIRVRYSETDQMGFVYYGNYASYYEIGRVELFRSMGFSYRELEESGIQMPVTHMSCRYLKPATYDEVITITTCIKNWPKAKVTFHYELHNPQNELINTGETTLVFIDRKRDRPVKAPDFFIQALSRYLEGDD